jgi:hypothetical protein
VSKERATHRVSDRVGGLRVHQRPNSKKLVEPLELQPGYHVDILSLYHGGKKIWAEIEYLYNGKYYQGWVIVDALDPAPPPPYFPPAPEPPPIPPPDVPRPDTLGTPLPPRVEKPPVGERIPTWVTVLVAAAFAVIAYVVFAH